MKRLQRGVIKGQARQDQPLNSEEQLLKIASSTQFTNELVRNHGLMEKNLANDQESKRVLLRKNRYRPF